ncbi:hypothetical protein K438DRAFT_1768841 [Mycena galopus ATCC 62051]|nr:hypothetical protein K438DRAFT_1768841 [Mycena galopus ATCC 62051]
MNLAKPSRRKPGKVLSGIFGSLGGFHRMTDAFLGVDGSNRRRAKWVLATMSEFCGSSVEHPWVLDSHGDLVLRGIPSTDCPPGSFGAAQAQNYLPGPAFLHHTRPPRKPESSLNAEFEARRRTSSSHIRAARDRITQTPRNDRPSLTSDQNQGPQGAAVAPTTSSAATRPNSKLQARQYPPAFEEGSAHLPAPHTTGHGGPQCIRPNAAGETSFFEGRFAGGPSTKRKVPQLVVSETVATASHTTADGRRVRIRTGLHSIKLQFREKFWVYPEGLSRNSMGLPIGYAGHQAAIRQHFGMASQGSK